MNKSNLFTQAHQQTRQIFTNFGCDYKAVFKLILKHLMHSYDYACECCTQYVYNLKNEIVCVIEGTQDFCETICCELGFMGVDEYGVCYTDNTLEYTDNTIFVE